MLKLLLAAMVVALLFSAGLAVGLYHYWGWKGLIALPFLLVVFLWLAKTLVVKVVRGFFMKLFGMKGAVLEGASVEVHSVRPVAKQDAWDEPEEDEEEDPEDADEDESPAAPTAESEDDEHAADEPEREEEEEKPAHYYEVDLTISPAQAKCMTLWEPFELQLTSTPSKGLMALADDSVAEVCECHVWNGNQFEEDDPGKYEGPRRIKIVFAVDQDVRTAYLNYYGHSLAPISFPEWRPQQTEPAAPGT